MLKNIKIQLAFFMLLLLNWSCNSDEGNYNYNEINEFNVTGIAESYTVYSSDNLKITPNLNATLDDGTVDRYTYEWIANDPTKQAIKTVLATTKDLDIVLKLAPAQYKVYLFIKDNVTGVTWQQKPFILNVVSSIYEGWLVVGDVDGKARLDMVSILPNVPQPRIINDVLALAGSDLKLSGKAVNVTTAKRPIATPSQTYGIYVTASESGTSRLEENTFSWVPTQNIAYEFMGSQFPSNFGIDLMISPGFDQNFVYSKGNFYFFQRPQNIRYDVPINKVDIETQPFYAAPFIADNGGFGSSPVLFDKDKHRFLRHLTSSSNCSAMPAVAGSATVLDWNNTNSNLVYMTTSAFNANENFAVLKNISTSKFYLLRFTKALVQSYYKEILNAPDFDKATQFAVSPDSGYLFYAVGSKVYEYDNGTQSAKLMLDKGNEQVTYIGFKSNAKTFAKKLIVGSYGTTGTLELYTVPPVNGNLILDNTYKGLCKIVDVAFRDR